MKPVIAISLGCPSGIGPEVAVAAAAASKEARVVLVGDRWVIERAASIVGVSRKRFVPVTAGKPFGRQLGHGTSIGYLVDAAKVGEHGPDRSPDPGAGRAQLSLDRSGDRSRIAGDGLARWPPGPVSKHAIAASGGRAKTFRGHTEHLAARLGAREVVMAFWSEKLVISLVTTHLPVARVPRAITPGAVQVLDVLYGRLVRQLGSARSPGGGRGAQSARRRARAAGQRRDHATNRARHPRRAAPA